MLTIDEISANSPLRRVSPRKKILFGAVPLILCLLLRCAAVSTTVILVMAVSAVMVSRIPLRRYLRLLLIPFSFLIIGTVTITIGRHSAGTPMLLGWAAGGYCYGITPASLSQGALIILTALGAISSMYFITLNTPMNDILSALRGLHVPPLMVSLMELIYRYIFVILEEARRMRIAQESRLGYTSFRRSIRSAGTLCGALFLRALQRSDRTYAALEARGYEGEFKPLERDFSASKRMTAAMLLLNICLIGVALLERLA